jgi:hypothetical protein
LRLALLAADIFEAILAGRRDQALMLQSLEEPDIAVLSLCSSITGRRLAALVQEDKYC